MSDTAQVILSSYIMQSEPYRWCKS